MIPMLFAKRLKRRSARLIAVVVSCFVAQAFSAHAQDLPPPNPYELTDGRMVDLVSLGLNVSTTPISVGVAGQGGLTYSGSYVSGAADTWRHSTFGGIYRRQTTPANQPYQWYEVSVPGSSVYFRDNGFGTLEVVEGSGSGTLVIATGSFTYTAKDGTVYTFDRSKRAYAPYRSNQGLLARIERPDGEVIDYTYTTISTIGTNSRIQSIANNLGYQLHFDYATDTPGNAGWDRTTKVTAFNMAVDGCAPTAFTCTYTRTWPSLTYSSSGDARLATDALSRTLRVFLTSGRVSGVARPATQSGQNLNYTWTSTLFGDQVNTVYDGVGTWTYTRTQPFDPGDNNYSTTTTVVDPLAHTTVYDFDWNDPYLDGAIQPTRVNSLTSVTNALNQETLVYQNAVGVHSITPPEGNSTTITYNNGNLASVSRSPKPGSGLTSTSVIATYGDCSTAIRCGRPTSVTDARLNTTTYTYNAFGQLLTETHPAPGPTPPSVQPQTRRTYQSLTAWFRDGSGTVGPASSSVSRMVEQSSCATMSGQNGGTPAACDGTADEVLTTMAYQVGSLSVPSNLLPVTVTNGAGDSSLTATTTTVYDDVSNVRTVNGPLAPVSGNDDITRYVFDAMRQQLGVIGPDPDGAGSRLFPATRTTYNLDGQPASVEQGTTLGQTDANWAAFVPLQTATTSYNAQARIASEVAGAGTPVAMRTDYSYDAAGRSLCVAVRMVFSAGTTDACTVSMAGVRAYGEDRVTRNTYDAADQLTQVQTGYGTTSVLTERLQAWTSNGQVDWIEDGAGNRSDYAYDGYDRVYRLYFPVATVGSHAANTSDFEQYGYDANDNPTSKITRATLTFTTAFDALNRITSIDAPSGSNDVWYSYDNLDRRLSAAHASGAPDCTTTAVCTTWDALGRQLTEQTLLGTMTRAFDLAGRRTQLTWPGGTFYVTYQYDLDSVLVKVRENGATDILSYVYDNLGRRTATHRGNGVSTAYVWDGASRLTGLSHNGAASVAYVYASNPANQIYSQTRSNNAYAYGGTTAITAYANNGLNQSTSAGGAAVTWSAQGNLTNDGTRTYTYDAANRLTGTGSSTLTYDPLDRLAEMTGTLGARYQYDGANIATVYATPGSLAPTARFVYGPAIDELAVAYQVSGGGLPNYNLQDHQSSVVAITNSSGGLITTNAYDEYGVPRSGNGGRIMYTGQLWMPDFAAYHYRARGYRPDLGRFLQTDPVGYEQGLNPYVYVANDPVNHTDPTGMMIEDNEDDEEDADKATKLPDVVVEASRNQRRNRGPSGSGNTRTDFYNLYLSQLRQIEPSYSTLRDPTRPVTQREVDALRRDLARLQSGRRRYETEPEAAAAAAQNGWVRVGALSGGAAVYRGNGQYYTRDTTGHRGGAWKVGPSPEALQSGNRTATLDRNLVVIGR